MAPRTARNMAPPAAMPAMIPVDILELDAGPAVPVLVLGASVVVAPVGTGPLVEEGEPLRHDVSAV
jgi:hypothetical protein